MLHIYIYGKKNSGYLQCVFKQNITIGNVIRIDCPFKYSELLCNQKEIYKM